MRGTGWGRITTFAGTGERGHAGDGGPATKATLDGPFTCAFDRTGRLLVAEAGANCVRCIEKDGKLSTLYGPTGFVGEDVVAIAAFADGFVIAERKSRAVRFLPGGPVVPESRLREPHDVVVDTAAGRVYVADVAASQLLVLDAKSGAVVRVLGSGRKTSEGDGGPVEAASFAGARAVAVAPDGTLYVCEREGNRVRRVAKDGTVTTFAGTGAKGYTDGGPSLQATFAGPKGLAVDPRTGDLFVVDTENHAIRRIDAKTGVITTVAGGRRGPEGDGGPAEKAGLDRPHGVCFGPDGALYIADSNNHRVRHVERA